MPFSQLCPDTCLDFAPNCKDDLLTQAPNPSGSLVRGQIARCSLNQSFKGAAGPYVFDVICKNGTTWYLRAKSWVSFVINVTLLHISRTNICL